MRSVLALAIGFVLTAGAAHAQTTEIQTARSEGMGGAFRALAFDNSALDLNPAALVQLQKFDFEAGYYKTAVDPATYALQVSLADSITNAAGTGFAFEYRKTRVKPEGGGEEITASTQRYVTAVGYPIVPQFLAIGMNGKYVQTKVTGAKGSKTSMTSDFMLHSRPLQQLALCGGFDNLINGGDAQAPRTIVGGIAVLPMRWLALSADVFQDLATDPKEDHLGWAAGAQITPFPQVALRGGMYEEAVADEFVERIWTAGIGLLSETGSIDYSMRLSDGESETLSHHVTLSVLVF
jgi:opacity protein-like surface antigen